jgi:arginase family enzyme
MLNKSIRILNLDNSVIKQQKFTSQYKTEIIDLSDLGSQARLWMNKKMMNYIEERIQGSEKNSITFLGSGDFHHISHILINQFEQPLSLIIFDFHPDWDTLPPRFGCGSWLTQTLKNKNILKCVLIGVSSTDISSWWIESGNLDSLKSDRVEIYPYSHKPSLAFFKDVPTNISLKIEKGFFYNKLYWNELKGKDLTEFFLSLLKRIPTEQVYVSIDKDCLKKEYALTNWEEGHMSLEEFLLVLKLIKENLDIIGMDITGDYSKICLVGNYKRFFSKLDHPKNIDAEKFAEPFITATNEKTNLKILELLTSN